MARTFAFIIISLVLTFGGLTSANAALQNYSGGGEFVSVMGENPLNLSMTDTVSWATSYDPAWIEQIGGPLGPQGYGVVIPEHEGDGAFLTIQIGALTFTQGQDVDYPEFPWTYTYDGLPGGFDFIVDLGEGFFFHTNAFGEFYFTYEEQEEQEIEIAGGYFYDLAEPSNVPIPAAAWLLGSGLLGLAGLRRKIAK